MGKTIHLALAIGAIALLASCSKETVISRDQNRDLITYRAFDNRATRSGEVSNASLGNMGDLYVSAIKLNDAGYYFTNNTIAYDNISSSTSDAGASTYYWPVYKLGFYAANRSLVVDNSGTPVLSPYIPDFTVSRRALDDPDELMVALEAQQRDDNGSAVQLNFHHALAKITVQAQQTLPGFTVQVAGVQLGGFKSVGTFTFPQYNSANAASDAAWEGLVSANYGNVNNLHSCWGSLSTPLQYGHLDISSESLSGTTLTSTAQNIMGGNYFYVIPQSVTLTTAASGNSPDITDHYIDLLVNIKTSGTNVQVYPPSSAANKFAVARVYIPASTFEAGKSYTVTLNFNTGVGVARSGQSLFNGSSADQASVLSSRNYAQTVSSEFPNDQYILGSPIDYTASVANWETGDELEVDVDPDYSAPRGAVPGLFTVNNGGTQVYFSKGNLQCHINTSCAPTPENGVTWRFANQQYDALRTGGANGTMGSAAGWIDFFCWSGNTGTAPFGIASSDYYPQFTGGFRDWGENEIYNGEFTDPANTWRTLSSGEFNHLINERSSVTVNGVANARYVKCRMVDENTYGILIFPDNWVPGKEPSSAILSKFTAGNINVSYSQNTNDISTAVFITEQEFISLQKAGCVFLVGASHRLGTGVRTDNICYYWTRDLGSTQFSALAFYAAPASVQTASANNRGYAFSVRLVRNK